MTQSRTAPPAHPVAPGAGMPAGLRERKKLKTRYALSQAALDLFHTRGYEATTVDDIAAAIDVSKRTFFRYFDGKEEVLLSVVREASDLLIAELAQRPAEEQPLAALREAGATALRHLADSLPLYDGVPLYLAAIRLIESTPALTAAHLRLLLEREQEVVDILARREGVDPATDSRPRLLTWTYCATVLVANRAWAEAGGTGLKEMLDVIDAHIDNLGSTLAGHWAS